MSESDVQIRRVKKESVKKRTKRDGGQPFPVSIGNRSFLTHLKTMVTEVRSTDSDVQLVAASKFWDLISMGGPAIRIVSNSGVVPDLVSSLDRDDCPQLQYMAAGILNNIAAGTPEQTNLLLKHSAVPGLVRLITSPDHRTGEEAMTALGNIAADFPSCRELVLRTPFLKLLHDQVNGENVELSMLRAATWTFASLFKGNPELDLQQVEAAVPDLIHLFHSNDEEVLADACRALSYLLEYIDELKDNIIEANILGQLVQLLLHPHPSVLSHALHAVTAITAHGSGDTQPKIELIIQAGLLACLGRVLANNHVKSVRKDVCKIIIDIVHCRHSTQVTIKAGLIRALVNLLQASDLEIKTVAVQTIRAIFEMCTYDQLRNLANVYMDPLLELLGCQDPDTVAVCLEVLQLDGVFVYGFIGRDKGIAQLIKLLAHNNPSICKVAGSLLTRLGYTIRDDSEDELLDPSISFDDLQVPAEGFRFE